jgi:DNA repair protein RecN (Recombination protein N)
MLLRLHIANLAIIEDLTLTFGPGLTILTGETGAGKSLILEALNLQFGGKGQAKHVLRPVANTPTQPVNPKTSTHAVATITTHWHPTPALLNLLPHLPPNQPVVLHRRLGSRQSVFMVNDAPVEPEHMAQLADVLLDTQAQHELAKLFEPAYQLHCLDALAPNPHHTLQHQFAQALATHNQTKKTRDGFEAEWQYQQHAVSIWQAQLAELQKAQLTNPDEDQTLKQQLDGLQQAQEQHQTWVALRQRCQSGDAETYPGIIEHMGHITRLLATLPAPPPDITEAATQLTQNVQALHSLVTEAEKQVPHVATDELDRLSNRYTVLERLKRKTGKTLPALMAWQTQLTDKLGKLADPQATLDELTEQLATQQKQLQAMASQLTQTRQTIAEQLEVQLNQTLAQLALPHARLSIQLGPVALTATGQDGVTFLFSANPGQPLRPLAKVASGGELSRVLFALKCHLVNAMGVGLMVFDEIDTGLSGEAVAALAQAINHMAQQGVQVLAVTHQPIVAATGDAHWHIHKQNQTGQTHVVATLLTHRADKLPVLSRLASGLNEADDAVDQFVDRLLAQAHQWKTMPQPA